MAEKENHGVGLSVMDSARGDLSSQEKATTDYFDMMINLIIGILMLGGIFGFITTFGDTGRVWGIYAVCWMGLISAVIVDRKYGN